MPNGKEKNAEESMQLNSILELDGGKAPKALPEDTSEITETMALNPGGGEQGIQFIPSSQANNDAKVELGGAIGGTVPQFVGLGKEELMKYANDPFWVRLRWFLFILFWVIWFGMLVGAIVIIVLAPKCSDLSKGLKSVEENGPFYQVYMSKASEFSGDGKLSGLAAKGEYLQKLGVKTLIISQIFETKSPQHELGISEVINFKNIHPSFGTQEDFDNTVNTLKEKGIKVVLQIIPNHSSRDHPWFKDNAEEYYVLKPKSESEKSTWKSVYGQPAWTSVNESDPRQYLHQFRVNEADLNYKNDKVVNEMNEVLKFWYENGVDGFLLSDVSYLVEDLGKLTDEAATKNNPDNIAIVNRLIDSSKWEIPKNRTAPFALFDLTGMNLKDTMKCSKDYSVPVLTDLQTELSINFNETDLMNHFGTEIGNKFVIRRLSGPRYQHLLSLYKNDNDRGFILAMITFLVKGEVVIYSGDEFSYSDNQQVFPLDQLDINRPKWSSISVNEEQRDYYNSLIHVHNDMKTNETNEKDETTFYGEKGLFGFRRVTPYKKLIMIANVNGDGSQQINLKEILKAEAKNGIVKAVSPGTNAPKVKDTVQLESVTVPFGKALAIIEDDTDPLKTN